MASSAFGEGLVGPSRWSLASQQRAVIADGPDVVWAIAMDGVQIVRRAARDADRLARAEMQNRAATAHQPHLAFGAWDIGKWRGKRAILGIVDNSIDAWGYLALDEIVQSRR